MSEPKKDTRFKKGQSGNPDGKPAGTQNRITVTIKEAFINAFNELQNDPKVNLISWGRTNPTKFYEFVRAVMPTEVNASVSGKIITVTAPNMKKFETQSPDLKGTEKEG